MNTLNERDTIADKHSDNHLELLTQIEPSTEQMRLRTTNAYRCAGRVVYACLGTFGI